jgi:hypothetical protein
VASGQSKKTHAARIPEGTLSWWCNTQQNAAGEIMFQHASYFQLNGDAIDDSEGEALMARHHIQVDQP